MHRRGRRRRVPRRDRRGVAAAGAARAVHARAARVRRARRRDQGRPERPRGHGAQAGPLRGQDPAGLRALVRGRPRARGDAEGERVVHRARARRSRTTARTPRWTSSRPTSTSRATRTPPRRGRRSTAAATSARWAPCRVRSASASRPRRASRSPSPAATTSRSGSRTRSEKALYNLTGGKPYDAELAVEVLGRSGKEPAKEPAQTVTPAQASFTPNEPPSAAILTLVGGGLAAAGFAGAAVFDVPEAAAVRRAVIALVALLLAAPAAHAQDEGTPIVGGGSFNTAPLLEPGRYADTVAAGETVYWKVALQKGQVLKARATVDVSEIETDYSASDYQPGLDQLDYRMDMFSPIREQLSNENTPEYDKATTDLEGDDRRGREDRRGARSARARLRADPRRRLQRRQVPRSRRVVPERQRRRLRHPARRGAGRVPAGPRDHGRGRGAAVVGELRLAARDAHAGADRGAAATPGAARPRRPTRATRR